VDRARVKKSAVYPPAGRKEAEKVKPITGIFNLLKILKTDN